ncbi:MAG: phytanoyl-CoA dioxygenase family protein [Verrucomicrobiota bacterium]|nr:phytanoyl-CoA dioxygenase family protein [Verrucomicrobiota bacterium]
MTPTTAAPLLSAEEISTFNREGYLLYKKPVFPQEKFDKLKTHFDYKLANLDPSCRPECMDVPHFTDPALFQWLLADEVLDLVEPFLGPDICLFSSHFICKPKGDGRRVPWHEDSYYWKGMMDPVEVVTVWLAIDESTPVNGCMYVIPKTHDNGYSDYDAVDTTKNVFPIEIVKNQRDESKAVPCILSPNEASLHEGRLMHGSEPNTSNMRRCGYTMRYTSTKVKHHPNGYHQVYLARGRDHAGNTYADPGKEYKELAHVRQSHGKAGH